MDTSKRLTIFEGPDGGGKSTAAKAYAEATGARYVHLGPLKHVVQSLGRVYVEVMLPALLGYQDVVMDRNWLSEKPYGDAFRDGKDRLGDANRAVLERLSMRCAVSTVICLPPKSEVIDTFMRRREEEYLNSVTQLDRVWESYADMLRHRSLRFTQTYDFTSEDFPQLKRSEPHPLDINSAGNINGRFAFVGESFAEMKEKDSAYQWPFGSLSAGGCSQWMAKQLLEAYIQEEDIFWINADTPIELLHRELTSRPRETIVALGAKAELALHKIGVKAKAMPHPQHWKRFKHSDEYPLASYIKKGDFE